MCVCVCVYTYEYMHIYIHTYISYTRTSRLSAPPPQPSSLRRPQRSQAAQPHPSEPPTIPRTAATRRPDQRPAAPIYTYMYT